MSKVLLSVSEQRWIDVLVTIAIIGFTIASPSEGQYGHGVCHGISIGIFLTIFLYILYTQPQERTILGIAKYVTLLLLLAFLPIYLEEVMSIIKSYTL